MNSFKLFRLLLSFLLMAVLIQRTSGINLSYAYSSSLTSSKNILEPINNKVQNNTDLVDLNSALEISLNQGDYANGSNIIIKILSLLDNDIIIDEKVLSESYYLIGVYYLLIEYYPDAIKYLNLSIKTKDIIKDYDKRYINALYNLGVAYYFLGEFSKNEYYTLRSLEMEKDLFGESNPGIVKTYLSLVASYIELQEYDKAITFSNIALSIANDNLDIVPPEYLADIYSNLGVCYIRLEDFSKSKLYLDKSESLYKEYNFAINDNYINLINSLAIAYGALGLTEKSNEYYSNGISMALNNNSKLAFNAVNSYAIILGNSGKAEEGVNLLKDALSRAKSDSIDNYHNYFNVLNNYANYLREYNIDNGKSLEYFKSCMDYLKKGTQDDLFVSSVYIGYALSLTKAGESEKALEILQSIILSEDGQKAKNDMFDNPGIESVQPDKKSLRLFRAKYNILWDMYFKSSDNEILAAAANTAELIVKLLEKIRINISEDESRLILGDKYRDSYINAIRDFNLLYSKTGDHHFLEKAFEYSEKSKVAGLLTSTRELKASQFHIPADIAEFERKLQREISLYHALIAESDLASKSDSLLYSKLKENLLNTTRRRDSLINVFERKYPDYYTLKYNTQVINLKGVTKITGRNGNYLNYIVSDSLLYIFIVNRKIQQLLAIDIDSTFINNIIQFRRLLSMPLPTDNAYNKFKNYQSVGYDLYNTLIEPVKKYLISDEILISPDNVLSYLPFETLPMSLYPGEQIFYRELDYMMNSFDISYTYSATFMIESLRKGWNLDNKVIAFAPNYPEPIDIESVLLNRQGKMGVLPDLPYARIEAEYVSKITNGRLLINNEAKEFVYKSEAGKFDIIHLAMHTFVNDEDPMHSTLIFSHTKDSLEDNYLNTYEIYGIPLKAKMVVLSSCNTGSGLLLSGEGVLSLARGFIYSGSQSVVMAMWEIEDRSGTEIIKMFYDNLKKGNSKSVALKKSRKSYLEQADQLRSHPYFWATLIIYGNNAPLYHSRLLIFLAASVIMIMLSFRLLYFKKRKYS